MKRGEVRWYTLKGPDKKRPVVILTRDSILEYLGEVTVVPVTSTIRNIPSEVLLSVQDGMNTDCAINCDHIQTVSKANTNRVGPGYYIKMIKLLSQKISKKAVLMGNIAVFDAQKDIIHS